MLCNLWYVLTLQNKFISEKFEVKTFQIAVAFLQREFKLNLSEVGKTPSGRNQS